MGYEFAIWFLIGAALVFFMQCGFAMVESGFTRAKSAGNIIMKNLMDFCIGTVVFILIGFGLMLSEDYIMGVIGVPNMDIFSNFKSFSDSGAASNFVFNLVFCATAATIVSGAMAERTKFISYCIYSAVISAVVYPIEAGWVWNSQGWLHEMGYIDFAGSSAIHMVGGLTALIGAIFVGPRIGKFTKDKKTGKIVTHAIHGHSLTLGALGVFILWFGWYGFNGAACTDISSLAAVFVTTTIAPAVATVVCMLFTWIKDGKPDVSMCLNASLAGLVGITAGCANLDALGSIVVGTVSGIIVYLIVNLLDNVLHIDDPVGAVAVHLGNGLWGTLAVGLLDYKDGLFYGGGFHLLGVQVLGVVSILAYTGIMMTIVFAVIKATIGLRVSPEEEISGLDISEHGLASAYADFVPTIPNYYNEENLAIDTSELKPAVLDGSGAEPKGKYTNISIICNEDRFGVLKDTLAAIGVTGMTVSTVMGCGIEKGKRGIYRGVKTSMNLLPKLKVDIVVSTVSPGLVVAAARKALHTGNVGDGKIFVTDIEDVMRVRTGATGMIALNEE